MSIEQDSHRTFPLYNNKDEEREKSMMIRGRNNNGHGEERWVADRFVSHPTKAAADSCGASRLGHYEQISLVTSMAEKYATKLRAGGEDLFRTASKVAGREVPTTAERVLDAPGIVDDYYLNVLDWSARNVLAVGLGPAVYLWDGATGSVSELLRLSDATSTSLTSSIGNLETTVCSLSWIHDGTALAVGTSDALVQIWDVETGKRTRTMRGHQSRIGSLAWNRALLSTGDQEGFLLTHDVRLASHQISRHIAHQGEVCGLAWSPDGLMLASGANDNRVCLWSAGMTGNQSPTAILNGHLAAVKAVAWCPWQSNVLATGGGSADRSIRLWDTASGTCTKRVDTGSQVSDIIWSLTHRELISSHGAPDHQLTIWRAPSLTRLTQLYGHQARPLHMAISPNGRTIVSAAADETIKFWNCFEGGENGEKSKGEKDNSGGPSSSSSTFLLPRLTSSRAKPLSPFGKSKASVR